MDYAIGFLIQGVCAIWVYSDAQKRDWNGDGFANKPWKWAIGVLLLWIIAFPVYLLRRGKRPLLTETPAA